MENAAPASHRTTVADLQCALRERPQDAALLARMADALGQCGQWHSACAHWQSLLRHHPRNAVGWLGLGHALMALGDWSNAAGAYQRAIYFDSSHPDAYASLALIHHQQGNTAVAFTLYEEAIRRDARPAETMYNLAALLEEEFRFSEARALLQRCIQLVPHFAAAHSRLAAVMQALGLSQPALNLLRQATRFAPNDPIITSNYLLALNYQPDLDQAAISAEHRRCLQHSTGTVVPRPVTRKRHRARLRVGYLSGDLRRHSVSYFIAPLIRSHARDQIDAVAFSYAAREDEVSERLKNQFSQWIRCAECSTDELVRVIEQADVDVLIDLSGHSGPNRWPVLTRKPAPCIATYLGYPTTMGLAAVDYRITDGMVDPPGRDAENLERVLRLTGSYYCYEPPIEAPSVSKPPVLRQGHITFGSFNNLAKLSDSCIALWARVITAIPRSCLLLKSRGLTRDSELATQIRARFAAHGVVPQRIILAEHAPTVADHLADYADIDIALDTFPYNGATTTCEALWMGVPVLTSYGQTHAGRMGASILHAAGYDGDIAVNDDALVARACTLADNAAELARRRRTQRDKVRASKLMDAITFTRDFERALVHMAREIQEM